MAHKWYVIGCTREIGEYNTATAGYELKGVYMAYANKGLMTGIETKEDAELYIKCYLGNDKYDFGKFAKLKAELDARQVSGLEG